MSLGIGVIGCGRVFAGPYLSLMERLAVEVVVVCDTNDERRRAAAERLGLDPGTGDWRAVLERDDVDLVLVLTSMAEHAEISLAALEAGKHVLVEKPLATTLEQAAALLEAAEAAPGLLMCAPHTLLSPTYRALHQRVHEGEIGRVLTARARYGWAGPWWGEWYYGRDGGALFDLAVYNITSLCGLIGPARRVTAMTAVAIPERVVDGHRIAVEVEDNAHVLIDFGEGTLAVVTTGFTMQRYRSPAIELYGDAGTIQLLGDDWAPEGYELWRNGLGAWQLFPDEDPGWPWTDGLRHLVDCIETGRLPVTRPEHAYHVLEIMLAAKASGADGRALEIRSDFPPPAYDEPAVASSPVHLRHDPRSPDGL